MRSAIPEHLKPIKNLNCIIAHENQEKQTKNQENQEKQKQKNIKETEQKQKNIKKNEQKTKNTKKTTQENQELQDNQELQENQELQYNQVDQVNQEDPENLRITKELPEIKIKSIDFNQSCSALIDTGADANFMSKELVDSLGIPTKICPSRKVSFADSSTTIALKSTFHFK